MTITRSPPQSGSRPMRALDKNHTRAKMQNPAIDPTQQTASPATKNTNKSLPKESQPKLELTQNRIEQLERLGMPHVDQPQETRVHRLVLAAIRFQRERREQHGQHLVHWYRCWCRHDEASHGRRCIIHNSPFSTLTRQLEQGMQRLE